MTDEELTLKADAWEEAWDRYNDDIDDEGKPVDDWGFSEVQRESFVSGVIWAQNHRPKTLGLKDD